MKFKTAVSHSFAIFCSTSFSVVGTIHFFNKILFFSVFSKENLICQWISYVQIQLQLFTSTRFDIHIAKNMCDAKAIKTAHFSNICIIFDVFFSVYIITANKIKPHRSHRLTEMNCLLNDVLEAVRPHVNLTFDNILAHINTIYVLKTKIGALAGQGYLRLKVSHVTVARVKLFTFHIHIHVQVYPNTCFKHSHLYTCISRSLSKYFDKLLFSLYKKCERMY